MGGPIVEPSGRLPLRMASMICASVHLPMPVSGSGVMSAPRTEHRRVENEAAGKFLAGDGLPIGPFRRMAIAAGDNGTHQVGAAIECGFGGSGRARRGGQGDRQHQPKTSRQGLHLKRHANSPASGVSNNRAAAEVISTSCRKQQLGRDPERAAMSKRASITMLHCTVLPPPAGMG